MAHPFKEQSDKAKSARLSKMTGGDAAAKATHAHEKHMHPGKSMTKFRAAGGAVDGSMPKQRMDKSGRKPAVSVNVNVIGQPQKQPVPLPIPVPAGGPGPMAGPPGGMPMPPPGAGPMMPPGAGPVIPMRKRGGSVFTAGSGSGEGRMEKVKINGKKAREVAPQNRKRGGKV